MSLNYEIKMIEKQISSIENQVWNYKMGEEAKKPYMQEIISRMLKARDELKKVVEILEKLKKAVEILEKGEK